LKRKSGDIDILDKQIALEQAIVGSPLVLGNKVTLLQDGTATYAAMFAAIRAARDHINLESYIIEDDEIGRQFADLLLEQQARGVQVNLIYDSFGAVGTPKSFFDRLTAGGITVLEFNPINPLAGNAPWQLNNRDHRKLLVVDGRTAFLGGINISNVYSSGSVARRSGKATANAAAWRDTDLQIDGPVVGELQKLFMETWAKQRGKALASKAYFPPLKPGGAGHRARHRQHAGRSLQPDLPDADLRDRQRRKAGAAYPRLLRSRSPVVEGAGRCGCARRRCKTDPAQPFRFRNGVFTPDARTIPHC
jgi:cardiolipin synthase